MKKLSLIFLFAFLLIIIGCSEDNTSPSSPKEENEFLSKTHPNLSVAVRNNVPEDMVKPTIGILDKDRTETFANVVYIISEKSVFYQFEYDGEVWARNDYEHVRYHDNESLGKITSDSPKLGKLYSGENYNSLIGDKLIIENIENIDYSGYFSSTSYGSWVYDDHKTVGSCKYIDQDDISIGYETWSFDFDCWNFTYPDGSEGIWYYDTCSSSDVWDDNELSIETWVEVYITYTNNTPPPPAPSLVAPSNGATTGTTVYFNWNASTGVDVDSYYIEVKNAITYEVVKTDEVTGTAKTFSNFSYSTPYTWKVKAHNAGGYGSWSSSRSFTVQSPPPPSITVSSIGNHQYSASASGGSGSYTSYEWWYRKDGDPLSREPQVGVWIKNSSWDDQTTVTFDPSYNFSLKCKVTDSNSQTAEDIYSERSLR